MPSHTEAKEYQYNRALSSGPILGPRSHGPAGATGLWGPGPQDWSRTRDLVKGPDAYGTFDSKTCGDKRFRSLTGADIGAANKFGPNYKDLNDYFNGSNGHVECWSGNVLKGVPSWSANPVRPEPFSPDRNWKLDAHNANYSNSFTTNDRSRKASFGLSSAPRFHYPKNFGRDYSQTGRTLNNYEKCFDARNPRPAYPRRRRSNSSPTISMAQTLPAASQQKLLTAAAAWNSADQLQPRTLALIRGDCSLVFPRTPQEPQEPQGLTFLTDPKLD